MITLSKNTNVVPLGILSDTDLGGGGSSNKQIYTLSDFNIDKSSTSIDCCNALIVAGISSGDIIIDNARFKDINEQFKDLKISTHNVFITCFYDSTTQSNVLTWVVSSSAGLYAVGTWNKFNNTLNLQNLYQVK